LETRIKRATCYRVALSFSDHLLEVQEMVYKLIRRAIMNMSLVRLGKPCVKRRNPKGR